MCDTLSKVVTANSHSGTTDVYVSARFENGTLNHEKGTKKKSHFRTVPACGKKKKKGSHFYHPNPTVISDRTAPVYIVVEVACRTGGVNDTACRPGVVTQSIR